MGSKVPWFKPGRAEPVNGYQNISTPLDIFINNWYDL